MLSVCIEFLASMPLGDEETHVLIGQLLDLPVPRLATVTVPDAQELRRRTRECVVQLLMARAHGGAGLILVEDLHWADPSTIEVVEYIAGQISKAPILLVITSRSATINNAVGDDPPDSAPAPCRRRLPRSR